jgi:hypothetical protein
VSTLLHAFVHIYDFTTFADVFVDCKQSGKLNKYYSHTRNLVAQTQVKILHKQQTSHNKTILKPIWTPEGTASTFNIENLERFQSKSLRMIVDNIIEYVSNTDIRRNLETPTVEEERSLPLLLSIQCSPQRTPKGNYMPTTFLV